MVKKTTLAFLSALVLVSGLALSRFVMPQETTHSAGVARASTVETVKPNKTLAAVLKEDKTQVAFLLSFFEEYPDDASVIAYGGGYFIKEKLSADEGPYVLEILDRDEKTVKYRDDAPVTVAEVKEALRTLE